MAGYQWTENTKTSATNPRTALTPTTRTEAVWPIHARARSNPSEPTKSPTSAAVPASASGIAMAVFVPLPIARPALKKSAIHPAATTPRAALVERIQPIRTASEVKRPRRERNRIALG